MIGVRVEMPTNQPIVLLQERSGQRYVPIWIGAAEAAAIAYAQQGVVPPRPLTHDLLKDIIEALGRPLTGAAIVALQDGVFHAELSFEGGIVVESRASDAIALALRTGTTVLVADEVMDEAGVVVTREEDDEVEQFKAFLDHVSAEDFSTDEPGPTEQV